MPRALAAFALAVMAATPGAWADCRLHRGSHVILYSTTDDPAVLLWDSRARLRTYHAASFDEAQAILPHATLLAPGTHAVVMSCVSSYVESPIFRQPDDAVGVAVTSGAQHGITGWVLGSDVRMVQKNPH